MEGMKTDPRATYGDLQACHEWAPGDRLAEIRVPALVLHGESELDEIKTRAAALAEALGCPAPEAIPAAGHALLLEAPEALAERIAAFLDGGLIGQGAGPGMANEGGDAVDLKIFIRHELRLGAAPPSPTGLSRPGLA